MWSAVRWGTFRIMEAQVGTKAMNESHLFKPGDLLIFPWDKTDKSVPLTEDERAQLQAEMDAINDELSRQQQE